MMKSRLPTSQGDQSDLPQTDVLTPEQRQRCMASNKGRDTTPEVKLRKKCWSLGLRYKVQVKLIGKPDFVFTRAKIAVFVDGCFWHGCPVHYTAPKARSEFWQKKLFRNRKRDEIVNAELQALGWIVIRIWEHDLKTEQSRTIRALEIKEAVALCRIR